MEAGEESTEEQVERRGRKALTLFCARLHFVVHCPSGFSVRKLKYITLSSPRAFETPDDFCRLVDQSALNDGTVVKMSVSRVRIPPRIYPCSWVIIYYHLS